MIALLCGLAATQSSATSDPKLFVEYRTNFEAHMVKVGDVDGERLVKDITSGAIHLRKTLIPGGVELVHRSLKDNYSGTVTRSVAGKAILFPGVEEMKKKDPRRNSLGPIRIEYTVYLKGERKGEVSMPSLKNQPWDQTSPKSMIKCGTGFTDTIFTFVNGQWEGSVAFRLPPVKLKGICQVAFEIKDVQIGGVSALK